MGSMTMYKPTMLRDIIPYLRNIRQCGGETVAACPICEAGESNGHHLYVRQLNVPKEKLSKFVEIWELLRLVLANNLAVGRDNPKKYYINLFKLFLVKLMK